MVDVTDPTGIQKKLDAQWRLLDESNIDERDEAVIRAFVEYRRNVENRARNTRMQDLSMLRLSSDRAETSLVEMNLEDVERLLELLTRPKDQGGYGHDPDGSTMFGYKRALRLLFRYMDKRESYDSYPFHDEISLPDIAIKGASNREEMLTADEIQALMQATRHPRNRALISFLGDMAGRIGLVLSLRIGDIHLDGNEPYFEPNDDVKDGLKNLNSDEIPILHSRGELRTYVRNHHPEPNVNEAPLWPYIRGYDPENRQSCAVSDGQVRNELRKCARRAGVEKPVQPHNFRRTGVTRLSNSDRLPPQDIAQITGWSEETLSRMLKVYDYTTDAERNSGIHESLGFSEGEQSGDNSKLAFDSMPCGTCREIIPGGARYCPQCGAPRDEEARAIKDKQDQTVIDSLANIEDAAAREAVSLLYQRLDVDRGAGAGEHHSDSSS